ncbi:hypothetical protein [Providencia rettgeri]|uniref:hypothetical protein n=1 Tax=Providencia rettgeri TaxID=587 RepID=UPI0014199222|nr:hypothetical protein [Providencia rettgeri]NIH07056.1 hypothetical protein [Providencia rettgeri]
MKFNKQKTLLLVLLCLGCLPVFAFAAEQAGQLLQVAFDSEVKIAIDKILNDSVVKNWSMALATFLTVVCLFFGIVDWVREGSLLKVFVTVILFIVFIGIFPIYGSIVDTVFNACKALGDSMYKAAIGNVTEDVFVESFINAIKLPTAGFFDAFDVFFMAIIWYVAIAVLELAVYFAEIWLIVGLAIAKVIGVLFLPFLIAERTQSLFSNWCKFFMVWGVSAIFLKVTSIVTLVMMKASLNAVATKKNVAKLVNDNNFTVDSVVTMTTDNVLLIISLGAFVIIAALMIFGSFKLAVQCVGDAGSSAGSSLNNGATQVARMAMRLF